MITLSEWVSVLLFPAGVLVLALFLLWLQHRDEVRWAREAVEQKGDRFPAE